MPKPFAIHFGCNRNHVKVELTVELNDCSVDFIGMLDNYETHKDF